MRGRVAQESVFNVADGSYRCPATQQGFSHYTTNMRALAWLMLGYTEQIEYIGSVSDAELERFGGRERSKW
jgi:hypothetical protein